MCNYKAYLFTAAALSTIARGSDLTIAGTKDATTSESTFRHHNDMSTQETGISNSTGHGPECIFPYYHRPGLRRECTFATNVETTTKYVDCGGCMLSTVRLGAGIPCHSMTIMPGTSTTTVAACAASSTAAAADEQILTIQTAPAVPTTSAEQHGKRILPPNFWDERPSAWAVEAELSVPVFATAEVSTASRSHIYPDPCETKTVQEGTETFAVTRCMRKRSEPTSADGMRLAPETKTAPETTTAGPTTTRTLTG